MKKILSLFISISLAVSILAPCASAKNTFRPTFDIHARSAILYNVDTDTVVYDVDADKRMYPASLTKIMVAVLLVEKNQDLENLTLTVSEDVYYEYRYSEAVIAGFEAGQQVNGYDLLAYTMVKSCADASAVIAEYVAGGEAAFIELMNKKAKEIGMTGTHFTNCHGLHDENHYSTARDMCILTKYAMQYSMITDVVKVARYITKDGITLAATNFLIDPNSSPDYYYKYATGFKTGYTNEAGRCLASTATYEGMTYILILLGCPAQENSVENRYEFIDSGELYRWVFTSISYRSVLPKNETVDSLKVNFSWDYDNVQVVAKNEVFSMMPNEADDSTLSYEVEYDEEYKKNGIEAPLKKGKKVGVVKVKYAGEVIGTTDAVIAHSIEGSQLLKISSGVTDFLEENLKYIAFGALILIVLLIIFIALVVRLNSKKKKYGKVRNYKRF